MTHQEGDRLFFLNRGIQGGLEKWSVARGKAEAIFPEPLNPESQIVSLSPEGLVIICFIIPP